MFAKESGFGYFWVVVGAGRGFSFVVGVLSHCELVPYLVW